MVCQEGNISGAHRTLVYMTHILNLIYQFHIQYYSHILGKIPLHHGLEFLQITSFLLISLIALDL
jgi:hypothetical protein